MAQEKLLAQVRIGYGSLQNDVDKINEILKKINQGKKDISITVQLKGLEGERFAKISRNIALMVQQFTRLNNLILNINKNSAGLSNLGNVVRNVGNATTAPRATQTRTDLGNVNNVSGNIIKQSERTTQTGSSTSTLIQDTQGLTTNIVANSQGQILSRTQELINANTQFERSLNRVISSYKGLSAEQQKNLTNVRNTINGLTNLATRYDQNSSQYRRIITERQRMIQIERGLTDEMNRQPLQRMINNYRMLSTEQQQQPLRIRRIINEYNRLIALYRQEGREITPLIQQRNQYQRAFSRSINNSQNQIRMFEQSIRRSGVGEFLGIGRESVLGSGNRRAGILNKIANSFIYSMSAMAIGQLTTSIKNLVKTNQDFELGLINLARTMDNATSVSVERLGRKAIETAGKYGIALNEIQNAQTELARAGISDETDLSQLTETVALGLNTTEIGSAKDMVGFLISTIKQLNLDMSDSNKIVDEWNYLSDKFAVHSNDFAEAITKSGAASKNLGLTLEDVNSMVVVLGEATQASGNEIGNAIKTLESYLLRPKTVGVLESYGIAVKKNAKEFLDFKTIMSNVDEVLSQFEEDSIASDEILRAIGGTWRKNWIALLADGWDQIEEINRKQDEAIGYSAQENEKVMNTYAKQIEQVKVNFSELAIAIGDAGLFDTLKLIASSINGALGIFKSLSPELQKFLIMLGQTALVIKLLSMGIHKVFNVSLLQGLAKTSLGLKLFKNVTMETVRAQQYLRASMEAGIIAPRDYTAILTALNNKQRARNLSVEAAERQERAYAMAMQDTARTSRTMSMVSTVSILAIAGVIAILTSSINAMIEKEKEAKKVMEESIAENTKNAKSLEEILKYYKENYELSKTDENVKGQLIEHQKTLTEMYGEEANALDLVNGKLSTNIELMEEKKKKELIDLTSDLKIQVNANKEKKFTMPNVSVGDIPIPVLGDMMFMEQKEKMGYEEYYNNLIKLQEAIRLNDEEQIRNSLKIEGKYEITATMLEKIRNEIERRIKEVSPMMDKENQMYDIQKKIIEDNIFSTVKLNKEQKSLYDNLKGAFSTVPPEKYEKKITELIKKIQTFNQGMKSDKKDKPNFMDLIIPDMDEIDVQSIVDKVYVKMFNSLTDEVIDYEQALTDAKNAVQQMKSAQDELNDTGKLTEDNLIAILESNSDLINSLNDRKTLQEAINKVVKNEAEVAQSAYAAKLLNSKAFYDSMLKNNSALFNNLSILYKGDFGNFTSLANAKSQVESSLVKALGKNWSLYYKTQEEALIGRIRLMKATAAQYYMYGRGAEFEAEMKQLTTLRDTMNQLSRISSNIKSVNFTGSSFSLGSSSGSSGSSSSATTAKDALLKDRYIDINNLIAQQNALLEANKDKYDYYKELNTNLTTRISLLEKEKNILAQQKTNYASLISTMRSERTTLEKELAKQGVKFSGSGDEKFITNAKSRIDNLINLVNKYRNATSTSGKKAYEKYEKELETLQGNVERYNEIQQKELISTLDSWRNIDIEIKNINEELSSLKIQNVLDRYTKSTEKYQKAIEGLNYEIQRLGGETELAKTSDLIMEKVKLITNEIDNQRYALNRLLNETDSNVLISEAYKTQLDETQKSLRENILTLQELTKQQKENAKASISGLEGQINTIIDKGIELRKEALEEELNLYKEHVDKIIEERQRQYEAEDFEKSLKKEYENRQELVNKINRLNLDSSLESIAKRRELEKQLQEFDEKIEEMKTQRQRDLIQKNLEDNVAAKETETNEAIKLIDEEFDIIKRRALIHETILSESFQSLQSKLPELFQTLGDGVNSFFDTFEAYEEHFGETLGDVSQKFVDEILPQLENAFAAIDTYEERAAKMQIQALQLKYDNTSDNDLRSQYKQQAQDIRDAYNFEYEDLRFANPNSGFYTTGETPTQQNAQSTLDTASITADPKFQEEKAKLKIRDFQIEWGSANPERQKELETQAKAIRDIWGWGYQDLTKWVPETYDEKTLRSYAGGINKGLVTQTGQYLLHGSANNPEWVFTNTQMFNLIKNLATTIPSTVNNFGNEDIIIHMPIYGNVDKSTIPMIKEAGKEVVRDLRKALNKRGSYK